MFLTPTWYRVWLEHFGSAGDRLLTLRDSSLQALLPLNLTETSSGARLGLMGDPEVMDYMDGLAGRENAVELLEQAWRVALDTLPWRQLELRHVPRGSQLLAALQSVIETRGIQLQIEDDEVDPVAILCSTWDGYLETLDKKHRHEIRRKLRRAREGAEWSWRTVQTAEELERDLPIFFDLHERSAHDKARFMTAPMRAFFRSLSAAFLDEGILRLSVFRRDGLDLAATMSFVYNNRWLLYNSGFDPQHSAHSPGIAAVALAMQEAINERAAVFDFLSGDESYKYHFGASNTYTVRATATAA
ncbi:MAG: GNAT family N-acetyltransferase [Chloroflexota bacterium]